MDGIRKEKDQLMAEIQGMMAKKVELTNQLFSLKEHIQKTEAEKNSGGANIGNNIGARERAGSNASVKRVPSPIIVGSLDRNGSGNSGSPHSSNPNLSSSGPGATAAAARRASSSMNSPSGIPKSATSNTLSLEGILKKPHKRSPSSSSLKDSHTPVSATSVSAVSAASSSGGISAVDDFDDLDELLKLTDNILVKKKSKDLSSFFGGGGSGSSGSDQMSPLSPQPSANQTGSNGSLLSLGRAVAGSPTSLNFNSSPLSPVNKMVSKLYPNNKSSDDLKVNTKSAFTSGKIQQKKTIQMRDNA